VALVAPIVASDSVTYGENRQRRPGSDPKVALFRCDWDERRRRGSLCLRVVFALRLRAGRIVPGTRCDLAARPPLVTDRSTALEQRLSGSRPLLTPSNRALIRFGGQSPKGGNDVRNTAVKAGRHSVWRLVKADGEELR